MPAPEKIAFFQKRRDQAPNQELARSLVETQDHAGAESTLAALDSGTVQAFIDMLQVQLGDLSSAQSARVRKVMRAAGELV